MRGTMWLPPLLPEHLHHPQRKPHPPSPSPAAAGLLSSLWVGLSETHGHMESHSTRPFVSGSFTWHRVFKVPGCGVCWCFVPFYGRIIFRRPDVSHLVFPLVVDGHLGCFSTFRRLRIMLPSVGMSRSLSESLFSVLPGVYLGLELLGHVALL